MLEGFTSRSIPDWEHPELTGVILNRAPRRVSKGFFGFWTYYRARGATVAQAQFWGVPYWFLFALSAPVPLMTAARWHLRRRRQDTGRCHSCGYDLRATPGRCPECGAIARPPVATTENARRQ